MKTNTKLHNIWTRLDDTGTLFGVQRLDGESLVNYKNRILNNFIHKSNASYNGIINSALSQAGLSLLRAIKFTAKEGVTTTYPKRAIFKTDNRLLLCSRFNNPNDYTSDLSVELREKPYISIKRLVDQINLYSNLYTAELITTGLETGLGCLKSWSLIKAFTLVNSLSQELTTETFTPTNKIVLSNKDLIQGETYLSDTNCYHDEVLSDEYLNNIPGYYTMDYPNGTIHSVSFPGQNVRVTYSYHNEPFELYFSPIIVSEIFTEESMRYLFEEIDQLLYTGEEDRTKPGHPKKEMLDIANELMMASKVYWGK